MKCGLCTDDMFLRPDSAWWCRRCEYAMPHHPTPSPTADNVNHPEHYTNGDIECIDAIKAQLTDEEFRGYCKGNVVKYIWRERHKGGDQSLKKAEWYLRRLTK